ncbi:unnamed protein product [Adineta steineri]|uniref:Uncharacterized protein n=1 Tax=Adineta steineri TaxID=433720 RepID=A0A815DL79_9BILA|nr:unnamed protein product [Adineta steineri]
MNNKSLDMMIPLRDGATLDHIIMVAKKLEEIDYHHKEEERQLKYLNQTTTGNGTLHVKKSQYEAMDKYSKPLLTRNVQYPSNNETATHQQTTFNKKDTDRSYPPTNYYK